MTASSGFAAKGTTLLWNSVPVLELTNIGVPLAVVDDVDITNHDSPHDTEEFVPGILRGGEFTVEGNLIPTDAGQMSGVLTDLQGRTARSAAIIGPAGKYMCSFTAYGKVFSPSAPMDGKASVTIGFKVSGKSTFTSTAAAGLTTPFFALRDNGSNAVTPSPAAAAAVYSYSATLDAADTHVAIQPTASAGTIKVNGTAVVSGEWSGNIAVTAGTTRQLTVECIESNKASKIYKVHVTRPSA